MPLDFAAKIALDRCACEPVSEPDLFVQQASQVLKRAGCWSRRSCLLRRIVIRSLVDLGGFHRQPM